MYQDLPMQVTVKAHQGVHRKSIEVIHRTVYHKYVDVEIDTAMTIKSSRYEKKISEHRQLCKSDTMTSTTSSLLVQEYLNIFSSNNHRGESGRITAMPGTIGRLDGHVIESIPVADYYRSRRCTGRWLLRHYTMSRILVKRSMLKHLAQRQN